MNDNGHEPDDESAVRDALEAFNAEGVIDDPGRPAELEPEESTTSDTDIPAPG
jgi:hypothetical protein